MKRFNQLVQLLVAFLIIMSTSSSFSKKATDAQLEKRPFYVGGVIGYGSTDWSELVAKCDPSSCGTLQNSTPLSAGDSGAVVGALIGYEIQPHFAIEASFLRFPTTNVTLSAFSFYFPTRTTTTVFKSYTYAYTLIGKFMVHIRNTGLRGFADAGMAVTHRHDILNTFFHVNPTFGVGMDYVMSNGWMFLWEFQYIAGYDEATLTPATNYSPFLYSIHVGAAYRFDV